MSVPQRFLFNLTTFNSRTFFLLPFSHSHFTLTMSRNQVHSLFFFNPIIVHHRFCFNWNFCEFVLHNRWSLLLFHFKMRYCSNWWWILNSFKLFRDFDHCFIIRLGYSWNWNFRICLRCNRYSNDRCDFCNSKCYNVQFHEYIILAI